MNYNNTIVNIVTKKRVINLPKCPFLSTNDSDVQCFDECALHNWKENGDICPFKDLSDYRVVNKKDFFNFEPFSEETNENHLAKTLNDVNLVISTQEYN
jgi:hypothetical protein